MSNNESNEPKGISFYSIRTGETHYGKLEPTIAGYINSSDLGINASRGQDYGWRLAPEWVKKVREFRKDSTQMSILAAKNGGQKPTTVQILYYMYGRQLQEYYESQEENENPFAEKYARMIANGGVDPKDPIDDDLVPAALADVLALDDDENDMSDLIDEAIIEGDEPDITPAQKKAAEKASKAKKDKDAKK